MYIHLLLVDDIVLSASFGSLQDLGLPDPAINAALPPLDADLDRFDHAKALALLEEYANLFSMGPQDFVLMKGTTHRLY